MCCTFSKNQYFQYKFEKKSRKQIHSAFKRNKINQNDYVSIKCDRCPYVTVWLCRSARAFILNHVCDMMDTYKPFIFCWITTTNNHIVVTLFINCRIRWCDCVIVDRFFGLTFSAVVWWFFKKYTPPFVVWRLISNQNDDFYTW